MGMEVGGLTFVLIGIALIAVVAGATLVAQPAQIALTHGSQFEPRFRGGSGHFDASINSSAVTFQDNVLIAQSPGDAEVVLSDRFSGQVVTLTVRVVAPQGAELARAGDRTDAAVAAAIGDINGDGYQDIVVANGFITQPESDDDL